MGMLTAPNGHKIMNQVALSAGVFLSEEFDASAEVQSIQVQVLLESTATITGSIELLGANGQPSDGMPFVDFGALTTTLDSIDATTDDSDFIIALSGIPRRLKLRVTVTSGTAVMTAIVNGRT